MNMSDIKQVVILAGGKGTRMKEMTSDLPKPMVEIGGIPVLDHLINIFENFGKFEFVVCTGYLGNIIQKHYKNISNVTVVDTGIDTNTGGRISKIKQILEENFIVTYGDGLANVNIKDLKEFHQKKDTLGTITVTNPTSRFGLVEFNTQNLVTNFVEKPKLEQFINIGFMVFKKDFVNYLNFDSVLETKPLQNLVLEKQLSAYVHKGYFEPMDTYREYLQLNKYWDSGYIPWQEFKTQV
jgi:glucose-1-phosphate cytidylyltransferase